MCHDGQLDVPHCAQDPAFLRVRGLPLPSDGLSFGSLQRQFKKASYNNVLGILINSLCALVDFFINPPCSLVDFLLYGRLSKASDSPCGGIRDAYLVVSDGIS